MRGLTDVGNLAGLLALLSPPATWRLRDAEGSVVPWWHTRPLLSSSLLTPSVLTTTPTTATTSHLSPLTSHISPVFCSDCVFKLDWLVKLVTALNIRETPSVFCQDDEKDLRKFFSHTGYECILI